MTINRRDLLECFGWAIPALALAPALILDADEDELESYGDYRPVPYEGLPYIQAFSMYGHAKESIYCEGGVSRVGAGNVHLIKFSFNAYGGCLQWIPPPGSEILVVKEYPVTVWSSHYDAEANALIRLPGIDQYEVLASRGLVSGSSTLRAVA